MNLFLKPVPIIALLLGLVLLLLGQPAAAGLCAFALIGSLALGSMRQANTFEPDPAEALDPDSRARFTQVRRLSREIGDLVEKHSDSALMRTLGKEAEAEAVRIRNQVADALRHRGALRKALAGRSVAQREVEKLEAWKAEGKEEGDAVESALIARRLELEHYSAGEAALATIDGGVRQAEAALSEMKARLEIGLTRQQAEWSATSDELRETIGRMKTLGISYDEAEEIIKDIA